MSETIHAEALCALQELKLASQKEQKKGLPFMLSSVIIWAIILYIRTLPQSLDTLNMYTLMCSCLLMPLSMYFGKLLNVHLIKKSTNPIDKLGFLFTMNQTLYMVIVIWSFQANPKSLIMIYAIVFAGHLLPYSWIYESISYKIIAIIETIGIICIFSFYNELAMILFVICCQIILCVSLWIDVKKLECKI
jgi:hypothetical protein